MRGTSRQEALALRARRLGLDRVPQFRELVARELARVPLNVGLDAIERAVAGVEACVARVGVPVQVVPPGVDVSGPLALGVSVPHGCAVGVGAEELSRMMVVLGRVGAGKTSLAGVVAGQLGRGLVFDRYGELSFLAGRRPDVLCFHARDFCHGLFVPPPGVDGEDFIKRVCETLAGDVGLFAGSENVLVREALWLVRRGRESGGAGFVLTLGALLERLHGLSVEFHERQYLVRVRNRLDGVYAGLGSALNVGSCALPYVMDRLVIVSLEGLDDNDIFVFVSQVLLWLVSLFEVLGRPGLPLRYPVVLDEAHYFLSEERARLSAGMSSFVSRVLGCRGRGVGLVLLSQQASALHAVAKSQAAVRVYLAQGGVEDAREAAAYLWGRDADAEFERGLLNLPRGLAYVRHPRVPDPLLIRIPYVDPTTLAFDRKVVRERSLEELRARGFRAVAGPDPGRSGSRTTQSPNTPDSVGKPKDSAATPGTRASDGTSAQDGASVRNLSEAAARFVHQVALRPFCTVKEVREALGMSGSGYDRVRRELLGRPDLLRVFELETGQRGRAPQWACLTPAGFALAGVAPPHLLAAESNQALHNFWKYHVSETLKARKQYVQIYLDRAVGGKKIDVSGVTAQGDVHGFEIELQPDLRHMITNVEKDRQAGAVRIAVLVPSKEAAQKAQKMLEEHFGKDLLTGKAISIEHLGDYLSSSTDT